MPSSVVGLGAAVQNQTGLVWGDVARETRRLVRGFNLPGPVAEGVHASLSGPHRVLPEGKPRVFAELTLLSFACASDTDVSRAAPLAVATEALVAAGDLVDDLQDEEVALQSRRTVAEGLEVVSLLLLLAHHAIGSLAARGFPAARILRALRRLDRVMARSMAGQGLDLRLEGDSTVSLERALYVTRQKSANMMKFAAELGALLGTDDLTVVALCGRFGWHLGTMAQLVNDIHAVWPGGPPKSDLRLGKPTVPIVAASEAGVLSQPSARRWTPNAPDGAQPWDDWEARQAIWRSGAIHVAWCLAAREKAKALTVARGLAARSPGGWTLASLLA